MNVLGLGLIFNSSPESDVKKIVCAAESAVSRVDVAQRDEARIRDVSVLSKLRPHSSTPALTSEERKAVKSLRENADIAILPADKGNATVLLDTTAYIQKMENLLKDKSTYARIDKDPTPKVQQELQQLLADVFHTVDPKHKSLYFRLLCHNGYAPALYGLPKIHKPGVPMRPIVDFTRSPLHKLSGYLHQLLAPLVGTGPTHVRNSSDFIEKL
ncbi:uncharacterized protein LOC144164931 [Haemaphysalis longicornis]